ncbi:hypothetical protein BD413DRAFT_673272 [Trametes elegans]|nr:hypothetical protein BD413DRAFT_673272 [Trametes elegans]
MGAFSWIMLAIILFIFLRQLPSHKLYVLTRDLQEAQAYFAPLMEEDLISGLYAEDYRKQLNVLQKQTNELQQIMKDILPFVYRDFAHIFRGVKSRCYKVHDDVEMFRNNIRRTGSYEKLRFDTYKMRAAPARDSAFAGVEKLLFVSYATIMRESGPRYHENAIDAAKRAGSKRCVYHTSLA